MTAAIVAAMMGHGAACHTQELRNLRSNVQMKMVMCPRAPARWRIRPFNEWREGQGEEGHHDREKGREEYERFG